MHDMHTITEMDNPKNWSEEGREIKLSKLLQRSIEQMFICKRSLNILLCFQLQSCLGDTPISAIKTGSSVIKNMC